MNNSEDWKTNTYNKTSNDGDNFDPIMERPQSEAYGTISHRRRKGKKKKAKDFTKFYDKEMEFVEAKYIHIADQQAKKDDSNITKYEMIRQSNQLMSSNSRKILQNRYKESVIKNNPSQSVKISKLFDTPVHQRLFVDNENRKKRIEDLKSFYDEAKHNEYDNSILAVSRSKKVLDLTDSVMINQTYNHRGGKGLQGYRSQENL